MKNKGGEKLNMKAALLLILLFFAFTPIITALTTTFILPTLNAISLAKTTARDFILEIRPMGDPINDPVGPG
jgi:hypothetical protein